MRFLIDANLPRSAARRVSEHGHDALDLRDRGLAAIGDEDVAALALAEERVILTRDRDFGDMRNYPPERYHGIVILDLPDDAHVDTILTLIERFLTNHSLLGQLRGRLAIVDFTRVRMRGDGDRRD